MLHTIVHGSETDLPPLVIVPGLFGSARNWGAIARHLSAHRRVIAVDQRNHGDSFHAPVHDYPAMADDIATVIAAEGRACDLLGHSMGGKAAMTLALTRPELVHRLVVADVAPVPYGHAGYHRGLIAAMKAMRIDDLTLRSEADRRLAERIDDPATRAFLLQSLELRDGPVHWKFDLDALDANMDTIIGWPDPLPGARPFGHPALFLNGGTSHYVTPAMHPAILALFPKAQFQTIAGVGHWLHAEKPREVESAIDAFLLV
ncbi:alpha/beta fold hydrolase [Paenirhodobacter enshiensis]|uniref:alpha/beta fold hydrolase n=1 Tax=Paenirhodobacter enshiensis TaxID=1105367 RepID=UPI003FA33781